MCLPTFSVAYWISHSKHKGFQITCDQFNLTSLQEQSLSQINDGLVHRAQSNWSVKKFSSELKQCVVHLCSVSEQPEQKMSDSTESNNDRGAVSTPDYDGDGVSLESQWTAHKPKERSASKKSNHSNHSERTTLSDPDTIKRQPNADFDSQSVASQTSRVSGASQSAGSVTKTRLISIERVTYHRTEDSILESTNSHEAGGVS